MSYNIKLKYFQGKNPMLNVIEVGSYSVGIHERCKFNLCLKH
jgi:hypothetical protein